MARSVPEHRTKDSFSFLPTNLLEKILSLLPLKVAVRTSVWSKNWRYNWANLPELVFDENVCEGDALLSREKKLLKIIYQVLAFHTDEVTKFTLSVPKFESSLELNKLVRILSGYGIQELKLDIWSNSEDQAPASLFCYEKLKKLYLSYCIFDPPSGFDGFKRISSLEFYLVSFAAGVLGKLVSSCPLLEQLIVEGNMYYGNFEIDAPNLKFLRTSCVFESLVLKNVPLLSEVFITSDDIDGLENADEGKTSAIDVFGRLRLIETLQVGSRFLRLLTLGRVPEKLPFTLEHLRVLQLDEVYCEGTAEISFLLCLMKCSPNLQKLGIHMYHHEADDTGPVLACLTRQDCEESAFNQLRELKMKSYSGTGPQLKFLKLIQAKSPSLSRVLIHFSNQVDYDTGEAMLFHLQTVVFRGVQVRVM